MMLGNETRKLLLWNLDWKIDTGGLNLELGAGIWNLGLGSGNRCWDVEIRAGIRGWDVEIRADNGH